MQWPFLLVVLLKSFTLRTCRTRWPTAVLLLIVHVKGPAALSLLAPALQPAWRTTFWHACQQDKAYLPAPVNST